MVAADRGAVEVDSLQADIFYLAPESAGAEAKLSVLDGSTVRHCVVA